MKIAIYSRKSKFTGKGDSIENQVQMCKDYASTHFGKDLEFDVFEDEGFSGENLNRPNFKKMMKKIKNYDVLICYRLDRISRTVSDFSSTLEVLAANNCSFVSIKEQFDTSTPMGRAMIYIASVFAQLERETIAERVKDNMLELAKNGRWSGGRTPLGYKSEYQYYIDDEGNERRNVKLVKDKEELKLVKLIYDTYLKEGSLHKTEVYFTQNNIKSKNGILLEKTSLKVVLQNPVYVQSNDEVIEWLEKDGWNVYGEADGIHGFLSYNKTESIRVDGKKTKRVKDKKEWVAAISSVEGVIDPETWLKVQKQFADNKDTFPRLGKTNNALLTGKLRCKKCGGIMIVSHGQISKKTGERLFYYVCSMKKRSKGVVCNCKNLKAREIEDVVINELYNLAKNKNNLLSVLRNRNKEIEKEKDIDSQKLLLEKKINENNNKINNLVEKLALDDSISDILISKIKFLKNENLELKKKLDDLNNEISESIDNELNIALVESILNRCMNIKKMDKIEQKQIIDALIDSIIYDDSTNEADFNFVGINSKKK